MSLIKHGRDSIEIQPDRTISEKDDGTLSGTITWKGPRGFSIRIGSSHPDDSRLEAIERTITFHGLELQSVQVSYFGLTSSITERQISYSGAQNQDDITTHPDFDFFAGNGDSARNGAQFETNVNTDGDEYYEFLGFFPFKNGGSYNAFTGVSSYLTAGTQVSVTYWTDRTPKLDQRMTIFNTIPGFTTPPEVGNFLLLDTPYRKIGSFYQVTEQYLGSGIAGFNRQIYRSA